MSQAVILIVDDEEDIRRNLVEHLNSRIDCKIVQAANGYQALEEIKKNTFDLILLDIKMPGISGHDVIFKIRETSPEVPIIVLTKWDSSEMAAELKKVKAEYIPKPYSLKIVRAKVEEKLSAVGKLIIKK